MMFLMHIYEAWNRLHTLYGVRDALIHILVFDIFQLPIKNYKVLPKFFVCYHYIFGENK